MPKKFQRPLANQNNTGEGHLKTRQDAPNQNELRLSNTYDIENSADFLEFIIFLKWPKDHKWKNYNRKIQYETFLSYQLLKAFFAAVHRVATGNLASSSYDTSMCYLHICLLPACFYLSAAHWAPCPENVHSFPRCCWCFLVKTAFIQRWSISDVSDGASHNLSEFASIRWCDSGLAVRALLVMVLGFLGACTWITTIAAPGSRSGRYHLWRKEIEDGGWDGNQPPSVKMEPPASQMAAAVAAKLGAIRRHAPASAAPARIYVDIHHRHMWPRLVASWGRRVFPFFLYALDDAVTQFNAAQPACRPRVSLTSKSSGRKEMTSDVFACKNWITERLIAL